MASRKAAGVLKLVHEKYRDAGEKQRYLPEFKTAMAQNTQLQQFLAKVCPWHACSAAWLPCYQMLYKAQFLAGSPAISLENLPHSLHLSASKQALSSLQRSFSSALAAFVMLSMDLQPPSSSFLRFDQPVCLAACLRHEALLPSGVSILLCSIPSGLTRLVCDLECRWQMS